MGTYLFDAPGLGAAERAEVLEWRAMMLPRAWVCPDPGYPHRPWLADDRLHTVIDEYAELADECDEEVTQVCNTDDDAVDNADLLEDLGPVDTAIELARLDEATRVMWTGEPGPVTEEWQRQRARIGDADGEPQFVRLAVLKPQSMTPAVLEWARENEDIFRPLPFTKELREVRGHLM